MNDKENFPVRCADWPSERELIERFRYGIYVVEQGKEIPSANHAMRRLPDRDDDIARHYVYERHGEVTGYARLHIDALPTRISGLESVKALVAQRGVKSAFLSKVMLQPGKRGGVAFAILMRHMYRSARAEGVNLVICHAADPLATQYQGFGWRRLRETPLILPGMAPQFLLILEPGDREHLSRSRPLLFDVEMEFSPALRLGCYAQSMCASLCHV